MSYGDYVERVSYLPFLKMADERTRPPRAMPSFILGTYAWPVLLAKDGDLMFNHSRYSLEDSGKQPGALTLTSGKTAPSGTA